MNFTRLLKTESYKQGFLLSTSLNLFTKLISFFVNILIAFYFGATGKTDLLFFAISFALLISSLITTLNNTIIIPQAIRLREQDSYETFIKFTNIFIIGYLFFGLLIAAVIYLNPMWFFQKFSKFSPELITLNIHLLKSAVLLIPFIVINTLLMDILISLKLFSISTLTNLVNSVLSVIFIYYTHNTFGLNCLVYSLLIANSLQFTVLIYIFLKKFKWKPVFGLTLITNNLVISMITAQVGNLFSIISAYFPIYLLSRYENGILTSLNFGQKIVDFVAVLIIVQFSSIFGIKLNECYAKKELSDVKKVFEKSANLLLFCIVPISILLSIYSKEICILLFKHGAFDIKSTENASLFVRYLILSLPFIALNALIARLFMAAQKISVSVYFQIAISILTMILLYVLVEKIGPYGYPLGLFLSYLLNILSVYFMIHVFIRDVHYPSVLLTFGKIIILNLPSLLMLLLVKFYLNDMFVIVNLLIGCLIYFIILLFNNYIFKINHEFFTVYKFIYSRIFPGMIRI